MNVTLFHMSTLKFDLFQVNYAKENVNKILVDFRLDEGKIFGYSEEDIKVGKAIGIKQIDKV